MAAFDPTGKPLAQQTSQVPSNGSNPGQQSPNPVGGGYTGAASQTNSSPYAGWQSVQNGDWNKAWTDWTQQKYGQSGQGAGFANMPAGGFQQAVNEFNQDTGANATANGDTLNFGNGQSIDAVTNYHGQGPQSLWSSAGGGPAGQPGYGGSSGGGPGGYGGGGGGFGYSYYTPGQLPNTDLSVYKPGNQQNFGLINSALQQALAGGSMSPDVVNQMQGALHDQSAIMQAGNEANIRQGAAASGIMGGGGEQSQLANARLGAQSNLLGQYRDINTQAAQQNYQDKLNAGNLYNNFLQGQEGLQQQGVNSQNAATTFALQRALEQEGLKQAAAGLGMQARGQDITYGLGQGQLGLGYAGLQNTMNQQALNRALGYGG